MTDYEVIIYVDTLPIVQMLGQRTWIWKDGHDACVVLGVEQNIFARAV
jgi:hypothetical protein